MRWDGPDESKGEHGVWCRRLPGPSAGEEKAPVRGGTPSPVRSALLCFDGQSLVADDSQASLSDKRSNIEGTSSAYNPIPTAIDCLCFSFAFPFLFFPFFSVFASFLNQAPKRPAMTATVYATVPEVSAHVNAVCLLEL